MKIFIFSTNTFKKLLFPIFSCLVVGLILYTWQHPSVLAIKNLTDHQILYRGDLSDPNIALTFNINNESGNISPLLTLLKKNKIHQATFFISDTYAQKSPKMVKKILEMGFEIGLLGDATQDYENMSRLQIAKRFESLESALQECGVKELRWIRLPNEPYTEDILDIAKQFNFTLVHSSVNTEIFYTEKIQLNSFNIKEELRHGDILSFDYHVLAVKLHKNLEVILPLLKKEGYTYISITDLVTNLGFETKEIH